MRIANNIPALNAGLKGAQANKRLQASSLKLSSGYKINSAKDDAAGLTIANRMKNQVKGIAMANRNSLDGVSLIQTADGGLSEIQNIVQRLRELAVSTANGTNEDSDREKTQLEIDALVEEIDAISDKVEFNGIKLLKPEPMMTSSGYRIPDFHIQNGQDKNMDMKIQLPRTSASDLGLDNISYRTTEDAEKAISKCDKALELVSESRAALGAYQNRLEMTSRNLDVSEENVRISLSRIMDTDMAKEMSYYTQQSLLSQSSMSILAQANDRPSQILQLLK